MDVLPRTESTIFLIWTDLLPGPVHGREAELPVTFCKTDQVRERLRDHQPDPPSDPVLEMVRVKDPLAPDDLLARADLRVVCDWDDLLERLGHRANGRRVRERPPGHRPGKYPPTVRPPGYRPPGSRPPGYHPPGYRPPRPGHLPAYGPGYWGRYPNYRYRWNNYNRNWWAYATAGAVTGWMIRGINTQPVYFDYGTNLYYEGDNVYYDGQAIGTAEEYAAQAQTIAASVPDVDPDAVEWLPLGVFALTATDGTAEDSTLFLQLAISKEGIIAGTFQNTATGKSFEVEGTIDDESQRAAWGPVGESWPIMETGVFNLTEPEAGALLHFEDGETQQWTLLRLDEPQDDQQDQ